MSPHSGTIFLFRVNQSLLFLLSATCFCDSIFFMKSNYIPAVVPFKGIIINVVNFGDFFSVQIVLLGVHEKHKMNTDY